MEFPHEDSFMQAKRVQDHLAGLLIQKTAFAQTVCTNWPCLCLVVPPRGKQLIHKDLNQIEQKDYPRYVTSLQAIAEFQSCFKVSKLNIQTKHINTSVRVDENTWSFAKSDYTSGGEFGDCSCSCNVFPQQPAPNAAGIIHPRVMVKVFPAPVDPYANTLQLKPRNVKVLLSAEICCTSLPAQFPHPIKQTSQPRPWRMLPGRTLFEEQKILPYVLKYTQICRTLFQVFSCIGPLDYLLTHNCAKQLE